jgi:hypothetical protein
LVGGGFSIYYERLNNPRSGVGQQRKEPSAEVILSELPENFLLLPATSHHGGASSSDPVMTKN